MGILDKLLGPPSKDKFASIMIAALKKAGDARDIEWEESEFRLRFRENDEDRGVLNLSNLYVEFCGVDKSDRKQCLKKMVRAALSHLKEMPTEFQDASYDIRPRLWTRSTFEQLRIRQKIEDGTDVDWPLESVGDHLFLSLVYDLPESVRSISNEDLENWGVTYWEAREVAIQNLADSKFVYASVGDELYASNTGDSYDATRLILTELVDEFKIEGMPIAMVPNRDTLLITGTGSEVGQRMMIEFAIQQLQEQPRPMTATPLTLGPDGEWVDWTPDPTNPLYLEFRKLELGWLQVEYSEQKQLLERLYEIQLVDDFVATFNIMEKDDELFSYSVWSPEIKSVLPKTDIVFFPNAVDEEAPARGARWADVEENFHSLLEPLELYPPRYRVIESPSNEELERYASFTL